MNFNPRTPRGVRRDAGKPGDLLRRISIHAPREGCDPGRRTAGPRSGNFNPRTPRGVRLVILAIPIYPIAISIHAPREGCDYGSACRRMRIKKFQSTHPARGATRYFVQVYCHIAISIHAPREGCDLTRCLSVPTPSSYFNPRTPRGVRPALRACLGEPSMISIHAPREGCDFPTARRFFALCSNFNPRTPRGVRQQTLPKSREFAWLNLLICTRGRRLSIRKQTRLCSMKLSFMLFGCEPAGEGVSSWTSHATKSKVRLEGRSAYSQSVRSSAHSDFPGNKSGGCPVRDP